MKRQTVHTVRRKFICQNKMEVQVIQKYISSRTYRGVPAGVIMSISSFYKPLTLSLLPSPFLSLSPVFQFLSSTGCCFDYWRDFVFCQRHWNDVYIDIISIIFFEAIFCFTKEGGEYIKKSRFHFDSETGYCRKKYVNTFSFVW